MGGLDTSYATSDANKTIVKTEEEIACELLEEEIEATKAELMKMRRLESSFSSSFLQM